MIQKKLNEPFVVKWEKVEKKPKHNFHSIDLILMENFLDADVVFFAAFCSYSFRLKSTHGGLLMGDNGTFINFLEKDFFSS